MKEFRCMGCGGCCRVSGEVCITEDEVRSIAVFLGLSTRVFVENYTRLTGNRSGLSLIERPDHSCVFLDSQSKCRINPVKPAQCRNFPVKWRFEGWEKLCEGVWKAREEDDPGSSSDNVNP